MRLEDNEGASYVDIWRMRVVQGEGTVRSKALRYACYVQGTTGASVAELSGPWERVEEDV